MAKKAAGMPGPTAGDMIRLKKERVKVYTDNCKAAGYDDFNPDIVHVVKRVDHFAAGGGDRLFVERAPFCFFPRDVELVLGEEERRAMLLARGWSHEKARGTWKAPKLSR